MELFLEVAQIPLHRDFFSKCGILECLDRLATGECDMYIIIFIFI